MADYKRRKEHTKETDLTGTATSMLVTDVGDEMFWIQFEDVSDGFSFFGHQRPLSLNISVGHQHPKDVTKILFLLPTF